jgi:hypothetical protein
MNCVVGVLIEGAKMLMMIAENMQPLLRQFSAEHRTKWGLHESCA